MKKKYLLFLLIILIGFLFIFYFNYFNQKLFLNLKQNIKENPIKIKKQKILIGNSLLTVEVADNDLKRLKGLSKRTALDKNKGMLFIFEKPGYYNFWMKDMNFSLDFIWVDNNKIIDLTKNVSKNYKNIFTAKNKFDKVIEVNAGFIKTNNIQIGDEIKIVN